MEVKIPAQPRSNLERVRHQLKIFGTKEEAVNPLCSGVHTRGYLPHVKCEGACYFVTFRLADSLPKETMQRFRQEKSERLARLNDFIKRGEPPNDSAAEIERDFRRKMERFLDQGAGGCHLAKVDIAALTHEAMQYFHGNRYLLHEWVIMPNHVHAVVWPMPGQVLGDILKSWKQFTSRHAKKILRLQTEAFWQRESYDHWIRNDEERTRIIRYVRNNPVVARLCDNPDDWRWSSAWRGSAPP